MILVFLLLNWPFPVTQLGKNLLAVRETWVKSLNWEDPLASVLSFLYSPTLISIHNYWKNQSFD